MSTKIHVGKAPVHHRHRVTIVDVPQDPRVHLDILSTALQNATMGGRVMTFSENAENQSIPPPMSARQAVLMGPV